MERVQLEPDAIVVNDRWDRTARWVTENGRRTRLQVDEDFRPAAQIARVTIQELYLVVLPLSAGAAWADSKTSIASFGVAQAGTVVLLDEDGPGRAVATLIGPGASDRAAIALAVVKASWGWDEAKEFDIRIGSDSFRVRASFDGKTWNGEAVRYP